MSDWQRSEVAFSWGKLNVWSAGSGQVVLALHGLGGSGRYWQGLAPMLDGRFQIMAPDLAGFGRSGKPVIRYDRGFHLGAIDELVAWSGGEPIIAGHSVGAVLAALWAVRRPERVSGLALISAIFPRRGLIPAPALRLARAEPEDRGRVARGVFRTLWPAISLGARLTGRFPPGLVSDYGRQSIGARADTMWTTLGDPTVTDDLAPLTTLSPRWPSLILDAADDRYIGPGDLARWQELLPDAERVIVPAGGHQFLIRTGFDPLAQWLNGL